MDEELFAQARKTFGILSLDQLLALGLTPKAIEVRVKRGQLVRLHKGVYAVGGITPSWRGRLYAAKLRLGKRAIVSHRSAVPLLGLEGMKEGVREFTLRGSPRGSFPGVRLHHSKELTDRDVRSVTPFLVTKVERTLIDLGAVLSSNVVEEVLESALFLGLTTLPRLRQRLEELRRPGRGGVRTLDQILSERDPDQAPAMSIFETRFYRFLRRSRLPRHVRQHPVHDEQGLIGRIDIAWPSRLVGVEGHSLRWHSPRQRVVRDAERHNRLTRVGWRMLYKTPDDLNNRPSEIISVLEALLLDTLFDRKAL